MLALVGCGGDDRAAPPADCGLPSPAPRPRAHLVPDHFVIAEAQVVRAQRERGGFIASLNLDLGVQDALARYRRVVRQQNYDIIQQDNEGFEAELYIRGRDELGAIQIRTSQCDTKSVVFVNVVDPDQLGGGLPSPSPTG